MARRIRSTKAQLQRHERNDAVLLIRLCFLMTRSEKVISKLITDTVFARDEDDGYDVGGDDTETAEKLQVEVASLLEAIEECESRLRTRDAYQRQHELAIAIGKALRHKKCLHLKVSLIWVCLRERKCRKYNEVFCLQNTYVHLAAECLGQLRSRELYSVISVERLILEDSSSAKDAVKGLLTQTNLRLWDEDKLRLIALLALHADEDEQTLDRLLDEAGIR